MKSLFLSSSFYWLAAITKGLIKLSVLPTYAFKSKRTLRHSRFLKLVYNESSREMKCLRFLVSFFVAVSLIVMGMWVCL